jgi:SAM-dependent methyltransferase
MLASSSSYDAIAGMYDDLWSDWYLPAALPALERLFFSKVPPGSTVLDLCCGSGHVTQELVRRDYSVTGVDNSAGLIALARQLMPDVDLQVQDARQLQLDRHFDAVLSTFDSLNHILTLEDLQKVFEGVYGLLNYGGRFVFDMNVEEAYSLDLKQWAVDIRETKVGMVRGIYDAFSKTARTELLWFLKAEEGNCWQQHRSVVEQRCYAQSEILGALHAAGFRGTDVFTATEAGVTSDLGFGRLFFVARCLNASAA